MGVEYPIMYVRLKRYERYELKKAAFDISDCLSQRRREIHNRMGRVLIDLRNKAAGVLNNEETDTLF